MRCGKEREREKLRESRRAPENAIKRVRKKTKLKATTQRVSIALRRTTSRALMEMERRAKTYPSVAVGAAQPPP